MDVDFETGMRAAALNLTPEQYRDAERIAKLPGLTANARAAALHLKYNPSTWRKVIRAAVQLRVGLAE